MMENKKPVYLLAGGRPRNRATTDPLIHAVFQESGVASPSIAYVGTASGDDKDFFNYFVTIFKELGAARVNLALIAPAKADMAKARGILKSSDIVFVSGGDVEQGMQSLKERNMLDFLSDLYKQGKLFFGLSAGSIMLAREWVRWRDPDDDASAELFPCLGFAPVICDTHDEQGGWQELQAALKLERDNTRGFGIASGTALRVLPGGEIEALGGSVHQYLKQGTKVERGPDLTPVINAHRR
jgi:peptidase E